jgi:xylulokinase
MFYLGFDCSTQGLTAIVIDVDGPMRRIVFQHSLNFDSDLPSYATTAGVCRGADPREVWSPPLLWAEALDRMMAIVAERLGPDRARLCAVSGSAQQHGSVYLNASAPDAWRALDPARRLVPQITGTLSREQAPVWMDESTTEQCRVIETALGGAEATTRLTGSRAYERFTGPQIRKFHQRWPEAYLHTRRIHLVSSFLASLLTGTDAPIDPGDGAGMNLMDIRTSRWSPPALDVTAPGLEAKLPPIAPSWTTLGPLSTYWQRRHGFPAALAVAWSGDNPCSLVGTGIVDETSLAVSLGTSDTVFAWTPEPRLGASHVFGSPMGGYMNLVCFRNGSLARERIRDEHGLDWGDFSRLLEQTPPGNGGAMMLPWFEAEITPHVAVPGVRRFDLDSTDAARNVRALVEAQMMAMANHSAAIRSGHVHRIIATGGGSTNRAILQVMADVFGVDVSALEISNAACLGAALRAYHAHRLAAGEPVEWPDVVRGFTDPHPPDRVTPIPEHVEVYRGMKQIYADRESRELAI